MVVDKLEYTPSDTPPVTPPVMSAQRRVDILPMRENN